MTTTKVQYINGLRTASTLKGGLLDAIQSLKAHGKDKPKYIKVEVGGNSDGHISCYRTNYR